MSFVAGRGMGGASSVTANDAQFATTPRNNNNNIVAVVVGPYQHRSKHSNTYLLFFKSLMISLLNCSFFSECAAVIIIPLFRENEIPLRPRASYYNTESVLAVATNADKIIYVISKYFSYDKYYKLAFI
ncbi:hypothetical protein QTP88_025853 [Uroleucon formosanum]